MHPGTIAGRTLLQASQLSHSFLRDCVLADLAVPYPGRYLVQLRSTGEHASPMRRLYRRQICQAMDPATVRDLWPAAHTLGRGLCLYDGVDVDRWQPGPCRRGGSESTHVLGLPHGRKRILSSVTNINGCCRN